MIQAEFFELGRKLTGFSINGHAGYADSGNDIVCAAVSSAVQLAANIITDGFHIDADVLVDENTITCKLKCADDSSVAVLNMLKEHLIILSEDFPKTIKITTLEV